jgi:fatty acid desaturase
MSTTTQETEEDQRAPAGASLVIVLFGMAVIVIVLVIIAVFNWLPLLIAWIVVGVIALLLLWLGREVRSHS